MRKIVILFCLCFIVFFQVKAEEVEMSVENTEYAKYYGKNTDNCSSNDFFSGAGLTLKELTYGYSGSIFDFLAYCAANDMYESALFDGPYTLGTPHSKIGKCASYKQSNGEHSCKATRILKDNVNSYTSKLIEEKCTIIRISGDISDNKTLTQTFNTPFIYVRNAPTKNLQIIINSPLNLYQNQIPAFNINKGWQVIANQNQFVVNKTTKDYLFYELAMNKITLNRNGQNFSSQAELINYLQNSDFFTKLGLNEIQKANSLNYILPQLSQFTSANNYYLTILSDQAIQEISELNINPAPKQLNRVYYAIYPTNNPIKTYGDLVYPSINQSANFTILESGEILVKPEMFVFWE